MKRLVRDRDGSWYVPREPKTWRDVGRPDLAQRAEFNRRLRDTIAESESRLLAKLDRLLPRRPRG